MLVHLLSSFYFSKQIRVSEFIWKKLIRNNHINTNIIPQEHKLPKLLMEDMWRNGGMFSDTLVHCSWQMRKAV